MSKLKSDMGIVKFLNWHLEKLTIYLFIFLLLRLSNDIEYLIKVKSEFSCVETWHSVLELKAGKSIGYNNILPKAMNFIVLILPNVSTTFIEPKKL